MVGDPGAGSGGYGEGVNLPPSPGVQGSALELKSDPQGVDFRPVPDANSGDDPT